MNRKQRSMSTTNPPFRADHVVSIGTDGWH